MAATRCARCTRRWSCCETESLPGLPPLSGGLVGFFAYDLVRRLERLPELAVDDLGLPDILLLLATDIAAVDHHEGTITLIANAVNWNGTDERVDWAYDDAVARLDVMTEALGTNLSSTVATFSRPEPPNRQQRTVEEYGAIVERLVGEIEAGEAFQVVPSQRFEMDTDAEPARRVPDAAGVQSQPVHVSAERARCRWRTGFLDRRVESRSVGDGARTDARRRIPSPAPGGAVTTRRRTCCSRRSCRRTRRNAPST